MIPDRPTPVLFFGGEHRELRHRLGQVVGGSLSEGVLVKLDPNTYLEGLSVGSYVTIDGQTDRAFVGLITDIALAATDPGIEKSPPPESEFMQKVYRGTAVFGQLNVKPMLVLQSGEDKPRPVKTVPSHFSVAYRSTAEEVQRVFAADGNRTYGVGSALDDDKLEINLDLERFVERSSAVFGRSGTGKTFLTLPLLASVIKQDIASVLVFDMHNDYGYTLKGDKGAKLKGLKQLNAIAGRVVIVTLDKESSAKRGSRPEFDLFFQHDQIMPEDLEMLKTVLSLTDVQVNTLFLLQRRFPSDWVTRLMKDETDEGIQQLITDGKILDGTFSAIQRKLTRLFKFGFFRPSVTENFVERILSHLERGDSVVVEFGRYGNDLPAYVFVANYLTRRIHERYVNLVELAEGSNAPPPRPLVIAVEEAHKFLDPDVANNTIFGTIARELRKYRVTLLIVDQRPSQIDAEVMSQIGTRITCALSDERDIASVFTGVSGAGQLRSVLASLDSKQQALIMGHAVPMPVVVKTADYGDKIYAQYAIGDPLESDEDRDKKRKRLLGRDDGSDGLV